MRRHYTFSQYRHYVSDSLRYLGYAPAIVDRILRENGLLLRQAYDTFTPVHDVVESLIG